MRLIQGKNSKSSWPEKVARKWLNIQSGADEFHSDYAGQDKTGRRRSCSDKDRCVVVPADFSEGWLMEEGSNEPRFELETTPGTDAFNLRMFVGTWNVGGKPPHEGLNLRDWLSSPFSADVYVLGFQEIVPLNAGNVLGAEDKGPAAKWLNLIRQALNTEDGSSDFSPRELSTHAAQRLLTGSNARPSLEESSGEDTSWFDSPSLSENQCCAPTPRRFYLAASKQMVGIFLCVWVRAELLERVSHVQVSCVGRGIMGYLGNKGSVSISMTLDKTSFCFVCTHLTSGEKEGDQVLRNSDVSEILRKTRFPRSYRSAPSSILNHDKIIWLGDLNYRLASAGCRQTTSELLRKGDWQALLHKDQLRIEQKAGRVFEGWEEGRIYFPPTYKYRSNSEHYVAQTSSKSKRKPRTPAWCDRILWKGEGIKQSWYMRWESKFSDHRPVYSLFSVQL